MNIILNKTSCTNMNTYIKILYISTLTHFLVILVFYPVWYYEIITHYYLRQKFIWSITYVAEKEINISRESEPEPIVYLGGLNIVWG